MGEWWTVQDQDDSWIQKQLEEEELYFDEQRAMFNAAVDYIIRERKEDGFSSEG